MNYLPFDNKGQAPTITLSAPNADRDPATPGIQAVESSLLNVKLDVADDVQVRNVELLVDGQVVANDVSFPWTAAVALPKLSPTTTSTTVQARATDTGGNTTLSAPLVVELVPDTFPPKILGSNLVDGSVHGSKFRTVRIAFSEAMDPETLNAQSIHLLDELGNVIAVDSIDVAQNGASVQIALPTLAEGKYQMILDQSVITDRAGNALGSGETSLGHFEIVPATIEWVNRSGGDWNNPANWDQGRLPDATDVVVVGASPGATITLSCAPVHVQGLETFTPLTLSTDLAVDQFFKAHESVTINGGTLSRATVDLDAGKKLIATNDLSNRLLGVTVNGDLDISGFNTVLRVKDLVLNGTASLGQYSSMVFEGTQRLDGHATIVFLDGSQNGHLEMQAAGTLTNAFVSSVGQSYTLVSFASRTGTFATLRDEDPADGVTYAELDAALNVTLNVVAG